MTPSGVTLGVAEAADLASNPRLRGDPLQVHRMRLCHCEMKRVVHVVLQTKVRKSLSGR